MLGRLKTYKDDPNNPPCPLCGSRWGVSENLVFDKKGNERIKVLCLECERFLKWKALPVSLERAQRYIIEFGRHSGKTLKAIEETYPSYIDWLSRECNNSTLKSLAQIIIAQRQPQAQIHTSE